MYLGFINDFYTIVIPLTSLIEKEKKFTWDEAYEKCFQTLKECLTTAPVLTLPQREDGFVIYIDGYGAVLK